MFFVSGLHIVVQNTTEGVTCNGKVDTEYGGILYRSILESRWAQFFDAHNIKHKYEPSKIDLGTDKYTPDFWLPEFEKWLEIKPWKQYRAHSKCFRLAIESRFDVLLVQGPPNLHVVDLFYANVRPTRFYRTVLRKDEIKPSAENFQFSQDTSSDGCLVLENRFEDETISFPRKQGPLIYYPF